MSSLCWHFQVTRQAGPSLALQWQHALFWWDLVLLKAKPWFGSLALAQSPGGSNPWFPIREEARSLVQAELLSPCGGGSLAIDGKRGMIHDAPGSRRVWRDCLRWSGCILAGTGAYTTEVLVPTPTRCGFLYQRGTAALPGFTRAALWVDITL